MPQPDGLEIWTVCFNPSDFPGKYTCRRSTVMGKGETKVDPDCYVAERLITIRREMMRRGLLRMPRNEEDDPVIVECWL
jgi:hypothetical protein